MSRSPDYILRALNKATEARSGKIGAAWRNENGTITLVLDVALIPDPNALYTLFLNDRPTTVPADVLVSAPVKSRKKKPSMGDLPVSGGNRITPNNPFGL